MKEQIARQLREKRKALGLTIEEVVEKTKIAPSVVKELESGHWENINPTYLKGFLKIYCSFLGILFDKSFLELNPAPEVPLTPQAKPDVLRPAPHPAEQEEHSGETVREYPRSRVYSPGDGISFPVIAKTAGILVVLFFLLLMVRSCSCRERPAAGEEETVAAPVAVIPPAAPAPAPKVVPVVKPAPVRTAAHNVEVTVTVKKDCFVKVKCEGKSVFEGVLKKGSVETWTADKEVEMKLSDGTAVDIEVNGKMLPPLTKMRKPIKSLKITPGGISVSK